MDTYFNTNWNCVKCGRCSKACQEHGEGYLKGRRDTRPDCNTCSLDYVPCHHCEGVWRGQAPCQKACHYNAIEIERW